MRYQILPPLSDEEYQALKQDIAERGVLVPVEYDDQGEILDGHHRVKACQELGITQWPSIVRLGMTEEEKVEHVLKLNIHRRHVSKEWKQEKAKELREQGWTQERIGSVLGVPQQTVSRWLNEFTRTGELPAELTVTGRDGKQYPASRAQPARRPYVVVDTPKDIDRVLKAAEVAENAIPAKMVGLKRLETIAREAKAAMAAAEHIVIDDASVTIHRCDFRDLNLDDNSVDLIFTDPPYNAPFVPFWGELGAFSAKVLKPGRLLVTYVTRFYFVDMFDQLRRYLRYVWIGSVYQPDRYTRNFPYRIRSRSKPLLFMSKGEYKPVAWFDDTTVAEGIQKEWHEWQQPVGVAMRYIAQLTKPGDLVVDPLLGSGTTAIAAKMLGRRFIGCDVDEKAVAIAQKRLASIANDEVLAFKGQDR